jgi:hypothetical protein
MTAIIHTMNPRGVPPGVNRKGFHMPANATVLTVAEVQTLADRLTSRGTSRLLSDQPEMQSDMKIGARVIRALLSKLDKAAAMADGTAQFLADLRIDVAEG